jgi:hypothetical protein
MERDRCPDVQCLRRAYERRIGVLRGRLGPPDWLRPGTRAYFVAEREPFADAFRTTGLYRRILPVIMAAAHSRAAIRVHPDGIIDAAGDAFGGNAHQCSLVGERLRFDRGTGWFSGPFQARPEDPPEWRQRPLPVLRIEGDRAYVFRGGQMWPDVEDRRPSDYASCGVRASFDDMVRVPASDEQIDLLLEMLNAE